VIRAVKDPAFGEKLKVQGIEIVGGGRKELDAFRSAERKRITELVKASGVDIK
jgi:tripartite-type tricarboxylate transporter receptor subunit TctC